MSPRSRRRLLRRAGGVLAGGSLIGAIGTATAGGTATGTAASPTGTATGTPRSDGTTPTVEFDAQHVAADGFRVTVELAVLPDGGFVAVHEGPPTGPIIGVTDYLPPGTHRHVAVELDADSPVTGRTELTAMPHRDTDGDEAFDFVTTGDDGPYLVGEDLVYDTALVLPPPPSPTPEPEPTVSLNFTEVPTATPSRTPSPTRSPGPTRTRTRPDGAVPGLGVVAGLVAMGAGALAARLRG